MSRPSVYVWCVSAAGCAVILLSVVQLVVWPAPPAAAIFAVLAVISGASVLRLRSVSASFSIGDAFSLSALFLYGPEVGTLTVALDTLAISLRLSGTPRRIVFNTAAASLGMWLNGVLLFDVAGLPLPVEAPHFLWLAFAAIAAVAGFFLLESLFVATAVGLHEGQPVGVVWRNHFASLWAGPVAGGYIGALVAMMNESTGQAALIALLPIPLILHQSFRTSLARTDDKLRHLEQLNRMYQSTIEAFATAVDAKDQVTHGHILRVQKYSSALAKELQVDDEPTVKALEAAALLHDVGKIGIPEHILNKPGRLTPLEYDEMRRHVTIGADILASVDFPFPVVPIVRHHHENWDGSGYPDGLRGTDIPMGARILMVVDCFDALTSDRPYRVAMSTAEAFEILRARRGQMYDPDVVDAFIRLYPSLPPLIAEAQPADGAAAAVSPERSAVVRFPSASQDQRKCEVRTAEPLARLLSELLPDSLCVIYEIDSQEGAVVARATAGVDARVLVGHRIPFGSGVSGWVAVNRCAIDDTDAILDLAGAPRASELRVESCTSAPLSADNREFVVTVYGPRSGAALRVAVVRGVNRFVEHVVDAAPAHESTARPGRPRPRSVAVAGAGASPRIGAVN